MHILLTRTIRLACYALIPIMTVALTVGLAQLLLYGASSNISHKGIALNIALLIIPVSFVLLVHSGTNTSQPLESAPATNDRPSPLKRKRLIRDTAIIVTLMLLGLLPFVILLAFGIMMRSG